MEFFLLVDLFVEFCIKVVSWLNVVLLAVVGLTFMDEGEDEDRKFLFRNPYLKYKSEHIRYLYIGCGSLYSKQIIMNKCGC